MSNLPTDVDISLLQKKKKKVWKISSDNVLNNVLWQSPSTIRTLFHCSAVLNQHMQINDKGALLSDWSVDGRQSGTRRPFRSRLSFPVSVSTLTASRYTFSVKVLACRSCRHEFTSATDFWEWWSVNESTVKTTFCLVTAAEHAQSVYWTLSKYRNSLKKGGILFWLWLLFTLVKLSDSQPVASVVILDACPIVIKWWTWFKHPLIARPAKIAIRQGSK